MGLNFTAIDFETANFQRGSVCGVGLTRVRDGEIVDTTAWHVDPPTGRVFTNTWIHGIGPDDVINAPTWRESLEQIIAAADSYPLLAYSGFDKGVHTSANEASGIEHGVDFIDVLAIARLRMPGLETYRLPVLAAHIGVPDFVHHEPGDDSRAAAHIALTLAVEAGAESIEALWQQVLDHRRARKNGRGSLYAGTEYVRKDELPKANPDADTTHPLYGHRICFSGALPGGIKRNEAWADAAFNGADIDLNVTKKTTLLVMGDFDPATLRPGAKLSSKVEKALAAAEKGQQIEIMTGADFIAVTRDL